MTITPDRLKPFLRSETQPVSEDRDGLLDAAQDAGIALQTMRKAAHWTVGRLADRLGMSAEDLTKAEAGQFVVETKDDFVDFSAALLVRVARLTNHKSIPLPE